MNKKTALVVDGRSLTTYNKNKKYGFRNWSDAWANILSGYYAIESEAKHFSEINKNDDKYYDLVVFCGSGMNVYNPNQDMNAYFNLVIDALEKEIPIIGSCFGMQTVCSIYGSTVKRMPTREIGLATIKLNLFESYRAFASHRDIVLPSRDFRELASNKFGCQAVELKDYPFLGLQHHPEWTTQDMMNVFLQEQGSAGAVDPATSENRFTLIENFLRKSIGVS